MPPASSTWSPARREYYDAIARADVLRQQRQLPQPPREARRARSRADPPRHAAEDDGSRPARHAGAEQRMNFAARCCAAARAGTSASRPTRSPRVVWERVYPTPYETLETGYPRNDVLVDRDRRATSRRVRADARHRPRPEGRPLRADPPRVRARLRARCSTSARLAEALGPEHVVLSRGALLLRRRPAPARARREGRVLDVAAHPSVEELCLAADVLVTDYSSIMFDYAVLDRPIVIHAPDWEAYRAAARHVLRPHRRAPGRGRRDTGGRASPARLRRRRLGRPARARRVPGAVLRARTTAAPPSASSAAYGSASGVRAAPAASRR